MKVTYIKHSSFLVEDEENMFLFDYYEGAMPILDEHKKLYCLASHVHFDHYSPSLFALTEHHPDVHYILSDDIPAASVPARFLSRTSFMGPDRTLTFQASGPDHAVNIRTLKSNDEGVAFIVTWQDKKLYHAGDLHDWIWEEEGEDYCRQMEADYLTELAKIRGEHFSAAFLLLDPRQSTQARPKGIRLFLEHACSDVIFPMYVWEDYSVADAYLQTEEGRSCPGFIKVSQQNQIFHI